MVAVVAVNLGDRILHDIGSRDRGSEGGQGEGRGLSKSQNGTAESRNAEGLDRPYDLDEVTTYVSLNSRGDFFLPLKDFLYSL